MIISGILERVDDTAVLFSSLYNIDLNARIMGMLLKAFYWAIIKDRVPIY